MAAKQASTKQNSLMLGYESDEMQLVVTAFRSRRDKQRLEGNFYLTKLLPLTTHAERGGGIGVCGDSKQRHGLSLNS